MVTYAMQMKIKERSTNDTQEWFIMIGHVSKWLTESDLRSDTEGFQRFESSHAHFTGMICHE